METKQYNVLVLAAAAICFALMLSPAAAYSLLQSGDANCPEDWYKFAEMCWTKIPEALAITESMAQSYCRQMYAELFMSDSVALCFSAAGRQRDWEKDYISDGQIFRKRVMGNNGM